MRRFLGAYWFPLLMTAFVVSVLGSAFYAAWLAGERWERIDRNNCHLWLRAARTVQDSSNVLAMHRTCGDVLSQ